MKLIRKTLLTISLSAVSLGGLGCQGPMTDEEALVGEASSSLTAAEESGDVTAEAVGGEGVAELMVSGEDASLLPPEGGGDGDGVCDFGARRARVIARYDANSDGRLDATERQALKADLEAKVGHPLALRFALKHRGLVIKRVRWVFDTNGDGSLSQDERTVMVDAFEARCEKVRANVLARFDANGNGTLDPSEKQAAKDALVARLQAARQLVLNKYDANHNGTLDEGERLQLKNDLIAAFQAKRAAVVAKFDADGDGTLNDAEKLALKQAIIARISGGQDVE